jgi:hypothetical protein
MGVTKVTKLLLAIALLVPAASAQFLGYVATQSTGQAAFTNAAANGPSSTFTNVGQSAHFLTVCPSSTFSGTIVLEESQDGTFASPTTLAQATYSAVNAGAPCRVLQAGGYYPTVRAHIFGYTAGTVSAFYTGIAGPISAFPPAANSTGPATPPQCDQGITTVMAPSTTNTLAVGVGGGQTGHVYICSITLSASGAYSAANPAIVITAYSTAGSCSGGSNALESMQTTASTPQLVQLTYPNGRQSGATVCLTTLAIGATVDITINYTIAP